MTVKGATALGLLAQGAKSTASLRPLLVTDAFLGEFGLGICGVGGTNGTAKKSWYLKVNHKNPEIGGESVKLKKGDEVLWALAPFPYPTSWHWKLPPKRHRGSRSRSRSSPSTKRASSKPAAGVTVSGASAPTAADGKATVVLSAPTTLSRPTARKSRRTGRPSACWGVPQGLMA